MKPFVTASAIALLLSSGAQLARAQASPEPSPAAPVAGPGFFEIERVTINGATLFTSDGLRLILAQAPASAKPAPTPGSATPSPPPESATPATSPASTPAPAAPAADPRFQIDKFTVRGATPIT